MLKLAVETAYILGMGGIVAFVLRLVRRRPDAKTAVGWTLIASFVALLGAVLLGGGGFFSIRLLAWGVFLHVPVLLAGCAALLRKTSGPAAAVAGLIAAGLVAVAVDAFLIEPTSLEVNRFTVVSPRAARPFRIGVLADFQTDAIGGYERDVIRRLAAEKPDLILMPGDYLQGGPPGIVDRFRDLLRAEGFGAPLGAYAVQGNCEHAQWSGLFEGLPVMAFVGTETATLDGLSITGLSFTDSFNERLRLPRKPGFHVVFGHGPDFALGRVDADLLVAGHTHGGQVRLPFIGPLITLSQVPRAWAAGRTDLPDGRTLIVSRGTGMERDDAPRLRFLCRPEIVVIDVRPP